MLQLAENDLIRDFTCSPHSGKITVAVNHFDLDRAEFIYTS